MADTIKNTIISTFGDCTIKVFIKCRFDKDYSGLIVSGNPSQEELFNAFDNINSQFLDLSGTEIAEIELLKSIHELNCRIESAKAFFTLQHIWLYHFDEPPAPAVTAMIELGKYGYKLEWNGDKDLFKSQLAKYEAKEKKNIVRLDGLQKQLDNFHKAEEEAETNPAVKKTIRNSRTEFIRLITELQKFGYTINREVTTMEELAIMYKEYHDYIKSAQSKN